ncbi:DUF1183-domain-containing protein [Athelia psychrophila]|uniref:Store-operated calcium entry-associated regulatory factor n=1 Tax=Athelia psychrophila TaxID=1759441 RepID=A0A165ZYC6_9AGAM|nr:DUF1183-domain-containing protein [Fibularhizoctonia sp. CBS 109695]
MSRVKLSSIESLTFYKEELTAARRTSPIEQLKCLGAPCRLYTPEVVRCENIGGDGTEVEWKCDADLPEALRFGRVEVSCEGYSRPGDPYVLKGSCGLEYKLIQVPNALRDESYHAYPTTPSRGLDTSVVLFWLFFVGIAFWIVYKFSTSSNTPNPAQANPNANRAGWGPGPGSGPGGAAWFPGGHHDDNDTSSPPPYSKGAPGDANASAWRPGFWTGAAVAGAGAALLNRNSNSNNGSNRQQRQQATQSYDWERERTSNYRQPEDRGEGSSNLGSMRRSTGMGGSSVR